MKRAILLDSKNKEFKEVEIGDGIDDIYTHLGCRCFDVVNLGSGVDMYIDDEGLLKESYIDADGEKHNMTGIVLKGATQVFMGNGLIMGHNSEGESVDSPVSIEQIQAVASFIEYDNPEDRPQPNIQFMAW
jgi:hypothetical protein